MAAGVGSLQGALTSVRGHDSSMGQHSTPGATVPRHQSPSLGLLHERSERHSPFPSQLQSVAHMGV